jgi:hypothetical protein
MPPLSASLGGRATREADEDIDLCRPAKGEHVRAAISCLAESNPPRPTRIETEGRAQIIALFCKVGNILTSFVPAIHAATAPAAWRCWPQSASLIARQPLGHRLGLASLMVGTPLPFQLPPLSSSRAKQPG